MPVRIDIIRSVTDGELVLKVSARVSASMHPLLATAREEAAALIKNSHAAGNYRRAVEEEKANTAQLENLRRTIEELKLRRDAALRRRDVEALGAIDRERAETETRIRHLEEIQHDVERLRSEAAHRAATILQDKVGDARNALEARRESILKELAALPILAELVNIGPQTPDDAHVIESEAASMVG